MKGLIFVLALLCGTGFILLCTHLVIRRSPEMADRLRLLLQGRGQRLLNLAETQSQQALVFASGHLLTMLIAIAVAWLITGSPVIVVLAGVATYVLPGRWFTWQRRKRLKQLEAELPDALLFIASALRAGSSLSAAIQVLVRDQQGALGQEFGFLLKEQRLGVAFDDAIQKMAQRVAIPDFQLVVVALRVSKEVGGNLSEPLTVLAQTLRKKAITEGRIDALTAQGRIQGLVMTCFPLLLLGVLYLMQPSMKLLFTTGIGWLTLGVMSVMLLLGYAMIRKIVAIDI